MLGNLGMMARQIPERPLAAWQDPFFLRISYAWQARRERQGFLCIGFRKLLVPYVKKEESLKS